MNQINPFISKNLVGDKNIWLIVILLNIFGIVVQFSAKARLGMEGPMEPIYFLGKSIILLIVSFYVMYRVSQYDYLKLTKFSNIGLILSWALIIFALKFGTVKGGASRWIDLGPISFMPSDLAKLCLTICLAKIFSTRINDKSAYTNQVIFVIFLEIGITCFLIMLSNFSTSFLIFGTSVILMYFGRVPRRFIGMIIGLVTLIAFIVVGFGITPRAETVKTRLRTFAAQFMQDKKDFKTNLRDQDDNFQLNLSKKAIASGALRPKGPGNSQFRYLLSQAESDFIFAIIIEEYSGFMGLFIPFIYIWLMWRGTVLIKKGNKPLGGILASGLTFSIVIQAFSNMLVSVGAIPVTGQPMPMISAGGTSLVFTAISIGLILAISHQDISPKTKPNVA